MDTIDWKRFRAALTLFVVLASVFMVMLIVYVTKSIGFVGSAPVTNTITVSGHGESFAKPDIASVSFSVEKTADTVDAAQKQATSVMNDVLASLKTFGIAEKDIQTTSYDVYPKYDYTSYICNTKGICPPSKQTLSGYSVSQSITLKIRNIEKAGDILGILGQKNVTNISGLTFSVEDDTFVTNDARSKAISEARQQADSLAKQLGVRLVRITSFSENNGTRPIYYAKDMVLGAGASAPSASPSVPVGQNKANSDVSITYEIQ